MSESINCPFCGGSGGADESSRPCPACNGQGVIVVGPPPPEGGIEVGRFVWALTENGCRRLRLEDDNTIQDGPPYRLEDVVPCKLEHPHPPGWEKQRATPRDDGIALEFSDLPPSSPEGT